MIKETCRINAGRLPVLVCISDTSIVESIHLAHVGAECGASAVVSAPPYYFAPGQPELAEFYEDLSLSCRCLSSYIICRRIQK